MSTQLIDILTKQLTLHNHLFKLAEKKTEVLKKNDIEALDKIIKEEQKYVLAIQQFEKARIKESLVLLDMTNGNPTLTEVQAVVDEKQRLQIIEIKEKLTQTIRSLQSQNNINQKLIEQSLQFINLSLDVILPQPENYNYGRSNDDHEDGGRTLFDSKA